MVDPGALLWTPSVERRDASRLTAFIEWLVAERGQRFATYDELHRWSVTDLDGFWGALVDWLGVRWSTAPERVLGRRAMPGAQWFPRGRLNYAEHLLFPLREIGDTDTAVSVAAEDGTLRRMSWLELRQQVAGVRAWLAARGVGRGDRVAALLPNGAQALVAMLATTALGAIWSSCSPEFGARAVIDRFSQIEPSILFAVPGYRYGGKDFDVRPVVAELQAELSSLRHTVTVPADWDAITATAGDLSFEPMAFDDPLWVLYSSGTTGLPKPIVHGHGGILVEHAKQLALHLDLGPGDTFFWFTTTGWMMWNLLVSGLAVGSSLVLYDGSPTHPDLGALWRLAESCGVSCFGVSAPFLQAGMKAGLQPSREADLTTVRTVGSTGAPLPPEGFGWVYDAVKPDVMLSSLSGGTDVCSAFVGGAPLLPVRAGEIPCRLLGCAVEAYDAAGRPVVGEVGELVITEPMPSMPIGFWGDADGSRLHAAYFEDFPGVWRHGDWVEFTERGSCIITGRSDATLNRGGVRMGTSDFYRVVEELPDVEDSLVIDTSAAGGDGKLLLFVVLADGGSLEQVTAEIRRRTREQLSPRHVPDDVIAIPAVPRTLSGKKCEVPVKRILAGTPPERAVAAGALSDPESLRPFLELAQPR